MTAPLVALLAALLAAPPTLPQLEPPRVGRPATADAAVVVGVERYSDMPQVPYAERDAAAFESFLRDTVGVPRDRVSVLKGNLATRGAIVRELAERRAQVGPGGTLWVYFSGHGAAAPDGDA